MGAAGLLLAGCGDDTVTALHDGGTDGSVSSDAPPYEAGNGSDGEEIEAATDAGDGGEAQAPTATRLLVSYDDSSGSQLVAFNLRSLAVDGILAYPGSLGTTFVAPTIPWLLERSNDVVARLDALQPWMVQSSWNVALNDLTDAGYARSYANPAWVVAAGTKDYVLRYDRNLVAVLDSTLFADGGTPTGTVDLSGQVQAGGDGYVETVGGYYDGNRLAYLLLGNINRFEVVPVGGIDTQLCTPTSPTIVALDTTSDSLVNLNADAGADASGIGWTLQGYGPPLGASPMVFDAPNDRLLVLESGCTTPAADGGAGPVVRSGVEAVSLTDGSTQMLLDLSSVPGVASAIFYFDAHHAVIQFQPPAAYTWDPTTSSLGARIPGAPDVFALDGRGNLIGVSQPVAPDGGGGDFAVTSVNPSDGGTTPLGQIPGSVAHGSPAGAQLWPAP
jgi:hypothetical protein